jgi:hypothetical protein
MQDSNIRSILRDAAAPALLVVAAILSAGCTTAPASATIPASPVQASATVRTPAEPTNPPPALEASPTALPCFSREDLAAMALADIAALPQICFLSSDGIETHIDQAHAIEAIDEFLQGRAGALGFREITRMGNSPDGSLRVARFEDEVGRSFLVAVAANRVLEMDPGLSAPSVRVNGQRLPAEELQALAEELITRELPEFPDLRPRLSSTGGVKSGDLYFFRYEYPEGGPWAGLPPLAQVGLTADGQVFSYLNTLYFVV